MMSAASSDSRSAGSGSEELLPSWVEAGEAVFQSQRSGLFLCRNRRGFPMAKVSKAFSALTKYSAAEAVGKKLDLLYGSRTEAGMVKALKRALGQGKPFEGELQLCRNDGVYRWCRVVLAPLEQGEGLYLAGALTDISEAKAQVERLAEQEARWRGIFENAAEGIYQSTPNGHYLRVNRALAWMYGYSGPADLMNRISDIEKQIYVDPTMRERFKEEIERYDWVHGLEYQVRRRDGRRIWISESARVVRDGNGHTLYYEGFIEEITQRKDSEAALRQSQEQLLEASRQAGMAEVATGVLHNMGNALNSINISVELITQRLRGSKISSVAKVADLLARHRGDLPQFLSADSKGRQLPLYIEQLAQHLDSEQGEVLQEIRNLSKSLEHIEAIVAMQQNFAKASSMIGPVQPAELLEDALRMNADSLARHGIQVVRHYAEPLPEMLVAKHKVLQVLLNLIRNAQKACEASEKKERQIQLGLAAFSNGKWIRVSVLDNGVGIPAANLSRIFNHGFTTRKDGHGFGLHNSALIAQELGGSLTAASDGPGKGASFVLELPVETGKK